MNTLSAINPDEIISILKEEIENYDEISQNQETAAVAELSPNQNPAAVKKSRLT